MATLKELRIRLKSLKNTRKITSAMKMVSAAKLRRAREAAQRSRPYIDKMSEVLQRLQSSSDLPEMPLLEKRDVKKTLYLVFSSDRGLCGGFNNNLFKSLYAEIKNQTVPCDVIVVGKKANEFFKRKKIPPVEYHEGLGVQPSYQSAKSIAEKAMQEFVSGTYDRVYVYFNRFVSTLTQKPTGEQLLPFESTGEEKPAANRDYLFEPNKGEILRDIIPKQIILKVFQCMLDNSAGEHAARMTAMDNATNNAKDIIGNITVQMNRARQADITRELIEVVSGAESLNQ